jgi:hypothetical protein
MELVENPSVRFCIRAGQTVGRSETADVALNDVPNLEYISKIHVRFLKRGTQWYAQHIGDTNFIKVDGRRYEGREEVAIYDNSILVLSLTTFRVTLTEA